MKKDSVQMDKQTVKNIIDLLEAARKLASNASTKAQDEHNYYNAYFGGRADALYEAIAIIKTSL